MMKTRNKQRARGNPITNFLKRNSDFSDSSEIERRTKKPKVEKKAGESSPPKKAKTAVVKKKLQTEKANPSARKSIAEKKTPKKKTVEKSISPEKIDKICSPEKPEKISSPEKVEKMGSPKKVEKTDAPEKVEKAPSVEKAEQVCPPKKADSAFSPEKVEDACSHENENDVSVEKSYEKLVKLQEISVSTQTEIRSKPPSKPEVEKPKLIKMKLPNLLSKKIIPIESKEKNNTPIVVKETSKSPEKTPSPRTSLISIVPKESSSGTSEQSYKILLSPGQNEISVVKSYENESHLKVPTLVPIKVVKQSPVVSVSTVLPTPSPEPLKIVPQATTSSTPTAIIKSVFPVKAPNLVPITSSKSSTNFPPLILIPSSNNSDQNVSINALLQNPNFMSALQNANSPGSVLVFNPPGNTSADKPKVYKSDKEGSQKIGFRKISPAVTITTTANKAPLLCIAESKPTAEGTSKTEEVMTKESVKITLNDTSEATKDDMQEENALDIVEQTGNRIELIQEVGEGGLSSPDFVEIRTVSSDTTVKRTLTETSKVQAQPSTSTANKTTFKIKHMLGTTCHADGKPYFVKKQTVYLPAGSIPANQAKKPVVGGNKKKAKTETLTADSATGMDLSQVVQANAQEIGYLKAENKKLRDLNASLQTKLKVVFQMSQSQQRQEETLLRIMDILPMLQSSGNGDIPVMPVGSPVYPPVSTLINNEVHLGQGVWLAKREFDRVMNIATTPSLLVRNLGVAVYGEEVLKNSSVLGKPCMRFTNRTSRPPLSPTRFTAIRETFDFWLSKHGFAGQRKLDELSHTTQYLGSKIQDLNRPEHLKGRYRKRPKPQSEQISPQEGTSESVTPTETLLQSEETGKEGSSQDTEENRGLPKPKAKRRNQAPGGRRKKKKEDDSFSIDGSIEEGDFLIDNWKSMSEIKQEPLEVEIPVRKPDLAVQAFLDSLTRDLERPDVP